MRLTSFGIVLAMMAALFVDRLADRTNAQIPERVLFQPGSYAGGAYQGNGQAPATGTIMVPIAVDATEAVEDDDATKTEWETTFGSPKKTSGVKMIEVPIALPQETVSTTAAPYLAYHRCPWTGRIHIIPYQKGYPDADSFPKHQSRLNHWLSSLPCREQNRPQIEYLGYYDPMPEILSDKPTRLQLILGYPNSDWTSACDNRWGQRQAQCKGIEVFPTGPTLERSIKDQCNDQTSAKSHYGAMQPNPGGFRGNLFGRGYYAAATPVRYANNGMGHSWNHSRYGHCRNQACGCQKSCNHDCNHGCGNGNEIGCNGETAQPQGDCAPPDTAYPLKSENAEE